jgi:hypothetical protein
VNTTGRTGADRPKVRVRLEALPLSAAACSRAPARAAAGMAPATTAVRISRTGDKKRDIERVCSLPRAALYDVANIYSILIMSLEI